MILIDWSVDIVKKQLYRFLKSFVEAAIVLALQLFFSLSFTCFVGKWAIIYAYTERGYEACGGEYLLVLLCFITSFYGIRKVFKYYRRKNRDNRTENNTTVHR